MAQSSSSGMWYRARIEEVLSATAPGERSVTVHYVDYGKRELLHYTALRKIKEIFMELPYQV